MPDLQEFRVGGIGPTVAWFEDRTKSRIEASCWETRMVFLTHYHGHATKPWPPKCTSFGISEERRRGANRLAQLTNLNQRLAPRIETNRANTRGVLSTHRDMSRLDM